MLKKKVLSFVLVLSFGMPSIAQDTTLLQKDKKKVFGDIIKLSGSLSVNTGYYKAFGIEDRQKNFQYLISGNANFRFFDQIDAPFSVYISQQNVDLLQPFNTYGISPKYKNLTLHLGYRSMQFSQYTLAGHTFLGVGAEYKLGKIRTAVMYGRLRKEITDTASMESYVGKLSYKRMGYGVKVGFANNGNFIDLIAFKGEDKIGPIPVYTIDSTLMPAENLALGVVVKQRLAKNLNFNAEYASSAYTDNTLAASSETNTAKFYNYTNPFYTPKTSSTFQNAYKATISYTGKGYSLNVGYNYVDPNYRTMGAYYFMNDVANLTAGASWNMFKNKLSFAVNGGTQRNNLNGTKETQTKRYIGSASSNIIASNNLSFNLNYSNYSSYLTAIGRVDSDSLDFYQVTQNSSGGVNYIFPNKAHSLYLSLTYQNAYSRTLYEVSQDETNLYLYTLSHNWNISALDLKINTSYNQTISRMTLGKSSNLGPVVNVVKGLMKKKMTLSLSESYVLTYADEKNNGAVNNLRFTVGYKITDKQAISFNTNYLQRIAGKSGTKSYSETRGFVMYTMNF